MGGVLDLKNLVGGVDVSQVETGVSFDLLDPNNPVYVLALPGLDEKVVLKGKDHKSFKDMLKGLGASVEVKIETGDEDDPNEVVINFEKMSNFKTDEIVKKITALRKLQQKTTLALTLIRKAQKDAKFQAMLSDPEKKESFLTYLEMQMEKLNK